MQATISIAGQGPSQRSYMGVFIGQYFKDASNNSIALSGGFNASYKGGSQQIGHQRSAVSTFDTGAGNAIYGANADAMVLTPDRVQTTLTKSSGVVTGVTTTRTPQASIDQPYGNLNGFDYYSVNAATKTDTPAGLGQTRTSQTMRGFVGGLVDQRDSNGNFSTRSIGNPNNTSALDIAVGTDATKNRASVTFGVKDWGGTGTSATFRLGGTSGPNHATSSFIDDKTYAATDRPADLFTRSTSVGGSGGAYITSRTSVVSYNAAPIPSFFAAAGVTPCTCEFMTWGWWGGDVSYSSNSLYNPGGRDRINLATYVAGTLTSLVNLPTTGTATYTGHAIGNVRNGAASYIAAGSYSNSWNFASQTGNVAISNFNGASYSGTAALTSGTVQFTGNLSGAGRTGSLAGAFFSSPTDPAKGQAGTFAVQGTGYKAAGTFAGQRP